MAGVVPDIKGTRHKVHIGAAKAASILLLPAMVMLCANNHLSLIPRLFTALALLVMIGLGYLLGTGKTTYNRFLIYEALYFLCFDASILIATYLN